MMVGAQKKVGHPKLVGIIVKVHPTWNEQSIISSATTATSAATVNDWSMIGN